MDVVFQLAHEKRLRQEYILTSTNINAVYYGSPAWARERDIWPPLASELRRESSTDLNAEQYHKRVPAKDIDLDQLNSASPEDFSARMPRSSDQVYEPLEGDQVIRLLGLEAGKHEDSLSLHFYRADLATSHVKYEALSYVWGKTVYTHVGGKYQPYKALARLNGHHFEVGHNLEQALRALRSEKTTRIIWVDAICINQGDFAERGHQVGLMSSIYRNATRVVVWLGSPKNIESSWWKSDSSNNKNVQAERSFRAICDVVNDWLGEGSSGLHASYHVQRTCGGKVTEEESNLSVPVEGLDEKISGTSSVVQDQRHQPKSDTQGPETSSDLGLNAKEQDVWRSPFWRSIGLVFQCDWFWRLWVFQEIVLARVAILKLGNAEISWQWVGLAAAILRTNYSKICDAMNLGGVYNAYFMFRTSRQSDLAPVRLGFLQLLRLTRQLEVTDPRDRIYGLLGIRTSDNDPESGDFLVYPDYTITTGQLWNSIALKFMTASNDLSLLTCVQYTTEKLESETRCYRPDWRSGQLQERDSHPVEVPSWVPQWNHVFRMTISPWDNKERFTAAEGLSRNFEATPCIENLVVQGIETGTIGHALPYMWHAADLSLLQSKYLRSFFTSESGLKLLARTLTAGRNSYGSIVHDDSTLLADMAAFVSSWSIEGARGDLDAMIGWRGLGRRSFTPSFTVERWNESSGVKPPALEHLAVCGDAGRFAENARRFCERRRLFLTLNGYIGLGPDTLREGDKICVLGGGDVPFILRPFKQDDNPVRGGKVLSNRKFPKRPPINRESDETRYLLVGECYVEGLMQGEAVAHPAKDNDLVGPVPPDLIMKTILEEAGQYTPKTAWVSSSFAKLADEARAVFGKKRENFEHLKLKKLQTSWFHIV